VQSLLPALFWQPPAEGMRMKSCLRVFLFGLAGCRLWSPGAGVASAYSQYHIGCYLSRLMPYNLQRSHSHEPRATTCNRPHIAYILCAVLLLQGLLRSLSHRCSQIARQPASLLGGEASCLRLHPAPRPLSFVWGTNFAPLPPAPCARLHFLLACTSYNLQP
jgi:hypothetical protein